VHPLGTAGYGSKRLRRECRDNVGKDHPPAETGDNLQRPRARGKTIGRRRWMVWRMSPYERGRRSNGLRGVLKDTLAECQAKGLWVLGGSLKLGATRLSAGFNLNAMPRTARVYSNQLYKRGMRAGA
jgi:hypothetical protein